MKKVFLIILAVVILYLPSWNVFFSGDDFFHLRISNVTNTQDFLSFFSFEKNDHSGSFYRPLTTQVFFFVGEKLFGLSTIGYHYFSLMFFIIALYLVYFLARELLKDERIALLALLFYAFSASHFVQVYYLSAFQELGMTVFYLLALLVWVRFLEKGKPIRLILVLAFFALSLLSKETAITFPLVAFIVAFYLKKQKKFHFLIPFGVLALFYLILRFKFGQEVGGSYIWDLSPKVFNTLAWYGVWAIGIPEMFLDFIGPALKINPKLFLFYPWQTKIIFSSFILFVALVIFAAGRSIKNKLKLFTIYSLLFTITLLPVLFLPWHKFPLELTLPLFGVALFLGTVFRNVNYKLLTISIVSFLALNLTSYFLTYQTHWVTRRGEAARSTLTYFAKNYPVFPPQTAVYFYNNSAYIASGWQPTRQLWEALSGSDALSVFYQTPIKSYYQEVNNDKILEDRLIRLGTKSFLGY